MDQEIEKISKKLMKELDEDRYRHTQGVMYTSAALAMRYGADLKKALLAGLLHDCAKCIPGHTKIKMCEKYNLEISEIERKNPSLLHAKLGAYLAKDKYDIESYGNSFSYYRTSGNESFRKDCIYCRLYGAGAQRAAKYDGCETFGI